MINVFSTFPCPLTIVLLSLSLYYSTHRSAFPGPFCGEGLKYFPAVSLSVLILHDLEDICNKSLEILQHAWQSPGIVEDALATVLRVTMIEKFVAPHQVMGPAKQCNRKEKIV